MLPSVLLAAAIALLAAVGWKGAVATLPENGYDARAHIAYAETLRREGRLPTAMASYEYATPPAYAWLALRAERAVDWSGSTARSAVEQVRGGLAHALWVALVALAAWLLAAHRRGSPAWIAGLASACAALLAAGLRALATASTIPWSAGQLLSLAWMVVLLGLTYALARELWPGRPLLAVVATLATGAVPIVLRLGTMFHPEMQFACLALAAIALCVRAARRGWPPLHGAAAGLALGLAALTRPTAAVVIAALVIAALAAGRLAAIRFLAAGAVVVVLVAGPWWLYQLDRYGNPLQSNLDRPGYMLEDGQPRSFYLSAPLEDLVLHPYRPAFAGELWPQFHADLWSDWFGGQHLYWQKPPDTATRLFLSSQSLLGVVASALALGGLALFAARGLRERSFALTAFVLLALLSWIAFLITLIRFPQVEGDPIKSSYMLYLTPVFALAAVAAADALWRRGRVWRLALAVFACLFVTSYAGYVVTAYPAAPR